MAHERMCIVDKKPYEYCGKCGKFVIRPQGEMFCSDNCREIFNVCLDFSKQRINASQAKARLDNLDISNLENFQKPLQKNIADIMFAIATEQSKEVTRTEDEVNLTEEVQETNIVDEKPQDQESVPVKRKKKKRFVFDDNNVNVD